MKKQPTRRARDAKPAHYKPLNGGKWITKERRLALYMRDDFTCLYCGTRLKDGPPANLTLDHLVPRTAKQTNNKSDNLITACRSCNSSRQDRPWADYATGGARERISFQRHLHVNLELAKAIIAGTAGHEAVEALR